MIANNQIQILFQDKVVLILRSKKHKFMHSCGEKSSPDFYVRSKST